MTGLRLVLFVLISLLALGCLEQRVSASVPEVIDRFDHDPSAFTQGLLYYDGRLFESTGIRGRSSLREVALETGEVVRRLELDERYFGEGLARVGERLIQLTWREGLAFVYDLETFNQVGRFRYEGEGWGLCYDGEALWMSDGSATLYRRDAATFEVTGRLEVTLRGSPLERLNELACVGDYVYANVWQADTIVQIDQRSGKVVSEIDASGLLTAEERAALGPDAVLNGIAYNPSTETFYLTGKLWPALFEVRFVER
ncbi:glutaminyl-peptide cyclotransferase [soil metagenome]